MVRERPTKTAIVKREFTFTRPSRATTWTLVVLRVRSETVRSYRSFGYASDLKKRRESAREFYLGLGNGEEREREKGGLEGLTRLPFAEKIAASLLAFVGLIERAE